MWEIPLKTVSEANGVKVKKANGKYRSEHWSETGKRHRQQKEIIQLVLKKEIIKATLPCHINLTRISTRKLDYDNLVSSQKYVLDSICDLLIPGLAPGRADGDPRITTNYRQEKGKIQGIRIEITSL